MYRQSCEGNVCVHVQSTRVKRVYMHAGKLLIHQFVSDVLICFSSAGDAYDAPVAVEGVS